MGCFQDTLLKLLSSEINVLLVIMPFLLSVCSVRLNLFKPAIAGDTAFQCFFCKVLYEKLLNLG